MTTTAPVPASETRERRRTERREAILAAARKVFAKKGFDGATMADIAREAGVAAGTVYLYYASKIDLFAALNARLYELINDALRGAQAPPDVRGGTAARMQAIFQTGGEHRDLLRLVFLNPDPRTEVARRMKSADEERLRPLVDLLRNGMETGFVRQGDATLLARLVSGLVILALFHCFVQSDGSDSEAYEEAVTQMVVGALAPA